MINYPANFTEAIGLKITDIWQRIAGAYAPFDIDVTTEKPASFGDNTGTITFTNPFDINGTQLPGCCVYGGVAYVNKWGIDNFQFYQPAWVFSGNHGHDPSDCATAGTHEAGHNLGLSHDGTNGLGWFGQGVSGYLFGYESSGNPRFSWGPIMGAPYDCDVVQWSKGEYPGATNQQNDLAIIATKLGYLPDDVDGTFNTAQVVSPTIVSGVVQTLSGVIERTADIDMFRVDVPTDLITGTVNVDIFTTFFSTSPTFSTGANLNTKLIIYNASNHPICVNDPLIVLGNECTFNGDDSTHYFISVQGVGDNTTIFTFTGGVSVMFSDYGSLGDYRIEINFTLNTSQTPQPSSTSSTITSTTTTSTETTTTSTETTTTSTETTTTSTETTTTSTISSTTTTSTISSTTTTSTTSTTINTTSEDDNNVVIIASAVGGVVALSAMAVVVYNFMSVPVTQYMPILEFF